MVYSNYFGALKSNEHSQLYCISDAVLPHSDSIEQLACQNILDGAVLEGVAIQKPVHFAPDVLDWQETIEVRMTWDLPGLE
jgi:hypothetical protein